MATYFVSDIHGQNQAFQKALQEASFSPMKNDHLYVIGDMIDRGPQSKEVLLGLMELRQQYPQQVFLIKGNHEQMFEDWLTGRGNAENYLRFNGGDATVRSFLGSRPLRRAFVGGLPAPDIQEEARQVILAQYPFLLPALQSLPLYLELPADERSGAPAVLLVHAGIRPGIPLAEQNPEDLLWIREPFFLGYQGERPIVFGHTPVPKLPGYHGTGPWIRQNLVGIDGGAAYRRGVMLVEWPSLQSIFVPIRDVHPYPIVQVNG
ncbi:metallophosphoesterase family protein [Brevibacillus choshinensis]|uniref:Serine/threonine protein phosphatase n=1 Tax=Brevibacillus choshinensis TaxID=54911 RepID=A0ABX7FTC6_BRECH|nr:metallophosphoesterase family protein [Brevibacillus choshinensis]QRG69496.1 serine/threonine protein phosphatase [Brevibacillus choshinensis]